MIALIVVMVLVIPSQAARLEEEDIFNRYRPLAMDESWSLDKSPSSAGFKVYSAEPSTDRPVVAGKSVKIQAKPVTSTTPKSKAKPNFSGFHDQKIVEVNDFDGKNITKDLFVLPKEGSANLTRLITGKEQPTFIADKAAKPSDEKPSGDVIATYKILLPIMIPAMKKTGKLIKPEQNIKYVKETRTEMVPVKRNRMKTVLKAEPLPQQVITDYVKTEGNSVPSKVDKLDPNERVLKSIVTNYS